MSGACRSRSSLIWISRSIASDTDEEQLALPLTQFEVKLIVLGDDGVSKCPLNIWLLCDANASPSLPTGFHLTCRDSSSMHISIGQGTTFQSAFPMASLCSRGYENLGMLPYSKLVCSACILILLCSAVRVSTSTHWCTTCSVKSTLRETVTPHVVPHLHLALEQRSFDKVTAVEPDRTICCAQSKLSGRRSLAFWMVPKLHTTRPHSSRPL